MTGKIALFAVTAIFSALTLNAAELYVSKDTGKNSNAGTKDAPFKNLQKALDVAAAGDKIHVAAGNYFGLMDKGYLEMKKPVEIYGGYTADFSSRSPLKNRTLVMPPSSSNGTANAKGLLNIELSGEKNANLVIDGIIFDKGDSNAYHATEGKPKGVDTGMLQHPPAAGANGVIGSKNPILRGSVGGGKMLIQTCVFNNGAFYGIQMGFGKGDVKLLNNVFTSNAVAAVEISGLHNAPNGIQLEFAYNTVLYSWARTKDNTDMGYGFRNMTMVDTNIHHNLIGLSSFSGIDRTRIDSNKTNEAARKIKIDNNVFFLNKQSDLVLPSGGGMLLRVFVDKMEDAEGVTSVTGNTELKDHAALKAVLNAPYLEGFLSATYKEKTDYDPNSPANNFRRALGMNQVGTIQTSVSMYGNRYPLEDALKLFGALKSVGAQAVK